MCSDPNTRNLDPHAKDIAEDNVEEDASKNQSHRTSESDDPEKRPADKSKQDSEPLNLNHYWFVKRVWHYNSIDVGPKCKPAACGSRVSPGHSTKTLKFSA